MYFGAQVSLLAFRERGAGVTRAPPRCAPGSAARAIQVRACAAPGAAAPRHRRGFVPSAAGFTNYKGLGVKGKGARRKSCFLQLLVSVLLGRRVVVGLALWALFPPLLHMAG